MVIQKDSSDYEDNSKAKRPRMEDVQSSSDEGHLEENASEDDPSGENAMEDNALEENALEEIPLEENVIEEIALKENEIGEIALEENVIEDIALEENVIEEIALEENVYEITLEEETSEESAMEEESSPRSQTTEDENPSSWLDEDTNYQILEQHTISRVRLPKRDDEKDSKLKCDESSYISHHSLVTVTHCKTFDVVPDDLGYDRADEYPLTMTVIGGTSRISVHRNNLFLLKLSNLHKNAEGKKEGGNNENGGEYEEMEEERDSDGENECFKPVLDSANIPHPGRVIRIKVKMLGEKACAASWSGENKVFIWDLSSELEAVNNPYVLSKFNLESNTEKDIYPPLMPIYTNVFTFAGHSKEGSSLDWSPTEPGLLASGDTGGSIHVWKPVPGVWSIDAKPLKVHTNSVKDIKWSPNETNVMTTCSSDKSIRVWDVRVAPENACMLTKIDAHDGAVESISWNPCDPLILSGGTDGLIKIWDIRKFSEVNSIDSFKYHNSVISVEWHPTDRSVFAASGTDDRVTQWNIAADKNKEADEKGSSELPPQLMFVHRGPWYMGEIHWHKQIPGVLISTAEDGWDVIRTCKI